MTRSVQYWIWVAVVVVYPRQSLFRTAWRFVLVGCLFLSCIWPCFCGLAHLGKGWPILKMKRHKKEQNLQQFLCSGLLRLHRQFCCYPTKASGAFGSPTQEHDMEWVGYREEREVAHLKSDNRQKESKFTSRALARSFAPAGPILLTRRSRLVKLLFTYTRAQQY